MITVIKYTFKEMFHKKALFFVLLLTLTYLTLYGFGIKEAYEALPRVNTLALPIFSEFITVGLYFASLIVAFLVVISSAGALSADVESGVMQAVLVKPIKRYEVVLGKFFGIGLMVSLYSLFLFFGIIFLNKALGARVVFSFSQVFNGALLFLWMPLILLSVCLWGSARMSTLGAGIMAVMLYGFALIGGWVEQIGYLISLGGRSATGLINAGIIASLLMPTDAIYRKMNSVLFSSNGIYFLRNNLLGGGAEPSLLMLFYAATYMVFMLYMAARSFALRDI
ncbi:MAG: type transport system permease protein [Tepidanaerobacteraceae bacterium]|uniref:ABC-2 family transporter protein n=1 Tax=Caldanaerovirga acetigignens TaxID=447595 RepID=A0A1M7FLT5_9FIRM|nr:hypothetical protein [Caldanaerovirga acetigignens]MDN5330800.1 type transport system permease protein [Tepidanaerobacteraceae bacterium]SHM04597.1 ABC-2 family transporter protein [Caldanaerovirga acetigignens]